MRWAFASLCWAVVALGVLISCTKKPKPPDPPTYEEMDMPVTETAKAPRDARPLSDLAIDLPKPPAALFFDLNSDRLKDAAGAAAWAARLRNTGEAVVLEGYTCPIGETAYNIALGYRRAESVRRYLVAAGVLGGRIEVVSFGEEHLAMADPEQFHLNRRVEIKVR